MSIRLMTRVWADDFYKNQSELLVMLAIADFANDSGTAWPSVKTLAKKSRCSERTVQRIISRLIDFGKLEIKHGHGPYGTNLYRILAGGCHCVTPGDNQGSDGVTTATKRGDTAMSPNPSSETVIRKPPKGGMGGIASNVGKSLHLERIKKAKQEQASEINFKYASEVADGVHWTDPSKRLEYRNLCREIKDLTAQIANLDI